MHSIIAVSNEPHEERDLKIARSVAKSICTQGTNERANDLRSYRYNVWTAIGGGIPQRFFD